MTWGLVAVAGATVVGGVMASNAAGEQAKAAESAAGTSAAAARYQADVQRQIYDQTREDQSPWRDTGAGSLNRLSMLMGVTPESGGAGGSGGTASRMYTPNDLLVGSTLEANQDLYAKDPAYRQAYDALAPRIAYVTANGTLADARRYEKYAPNIAAEMQRNVNTGELNQRISALAAQSAAARPASDDPMQSPEFGALARDFTMADYEADPGLEFRKQQGQQQIDRQAAARGGLISGAALKATQRFGQDLASQEYGNAYNRFQSNQNNQFNRLASLAGVGQTANNALQQAGSSFANAMTGISANNAANQGNALMAAGNARASGYQGIANAAGGLAANWPQQQQQPAYQVPQGYQMGSGYAGNALATSQGYQPLNHTAANAGYYD